MRETCAYTNFSLRSHKPLTLALLGGGALLAAWQLSRHGQPAAAALSAPRS